MKVSVITTVYNVEERLDKNIQAFLNQTYKRYYNLRQVIVGYTLAKTILKEDINLYKEECEIINKFIKGNIKFPNFNSLNK